MKFWKLSFTANDTSLYVNPDHVQYLCGYKSHTEIALFTAEDGSGILIVKECPDDILGGKHSVEVIL